MNLKRRAQRPTHPSIPSLVQKRTAQLLAQGMAAKRASEQAMAEFQKGVLAPQCCVLVDDEGNHNHD